jgi:valyl-tRNA synthetase
MSTYALEEIPFKDAYIHGILRDKDGKKFSKSSGNGIDPIEVISQYGCDALRLSLLVGISPGNDSRYYTEKIEGARNFVNKLWNISRFIDMSTGGLRHVDEIKDERLKMKDLTLADRWILARFAEVSTKVGKLFEQYDFSLAAEVLRDFTWSDFADWYLEIAKIEGEKNDILNYVLERLLILWHPIMPFVTEEIYKQFDRGLLIVAKWPMEDERLKIKDKSSDQALLAQLQEAIVAIRNLRSQYKIEPKRQIEVKIVGGESLVEQKAALEGLTRSSVEWVDVKPEQSVSAVVGSITIHVPLAGLVDVAKETERLKKEFETTKKYVASVTGKLSNADFAANAPAAVVESEKAKLAEAEAKLKALEVQLAALRS